MEKVNPMVGMAGVFIALAGAIIAYLSSNTFFLIGGMAICFVGGALFEHCLDGIIDKRIMLSIMIILILLIVTALITMSAIVGAVLAFVVGILFMIPLELDWDY